MLCCWVVLLCCFVFHCFAPLQRVWRDNTVGARRRLRDGTYYLHAGPIRGRRGFTRQPENSKRAHSRAPALQTPPKFHEKHPERNKKSEMVAGEGTKARNFRPPTLPHFYLGVGRCSVFLWKTGKCWNSKIGQSRFGQSQPPQFWPKSVNFFWPSVWALVGLWFEPLSLPKKKCQSEAHPHPKCLKHLTFPMSRTTPGQVQRHNIVRVQRPATPSEKHWLFCAFVLALASLLTFGKVNLDSPQTDIFWGEGGPPPHFCQRRAPPLRLTFPGGGRGVQNTTLLRIGQSRSQPSLLPLVQERGAMSEVHLCAAAASALLSDSFSSLQTRCALVAARHRVERQFDPVFSLRKSQCCRTCPPLHCVH